MEKKELRTCSRVVLYEPEKEELNNILQYYKFVDHAFILDNSKLSHEDDIRKLMEGKFESHFTYRHFAKNIGLCRAMNYGMKEAIKAKYDGALLMDTDSFLQNDIVSLYNKFIEMSSENNITVLAPVHLYDRSKNHLYEGARSVKWAMTSGCFYHVGIFEMLHRNEVCKAWFKSVIEIWVCISVEILYAGKSVGMGVLKYRSYRDITIYIYK